MKNLLYGEHFISIKDLTAEQIQQIIAVANKLKITPKNELLKDKIIGHCFFEPSTRTRLSFETATLRLGGNVIGFSSDDNLSIQKGETLLDSMRIISGYADLIVIRHKNEGAARLVAEITDKPIINAGDGANQHPTQALVDLFTIQECQQKMDNLAIAIAGDLKYSRTIHSFIQLCVLYNIRLFLVAPDALTLSEATCNILKQQGVQFSFHQSIEEIIPKIDILYMTRIQRERLSPTENLQFDKKFALNAAMLEKARANLKVLHPLPRVNEIDMNVDKTSYAYYFEQAQNGVYVRQALLTLLLNESLP